MVFFLKIAFNSLESQFMESYLTEELEHFIKLTEQTPSYPCSAQKTGWSIKSMRTNQWMKWTFCLDIPKAYMTLSIINHGYDVLSKTVTSCGTLLFMTIPILKRLNTI